jgi:hypothetical protein
MPLIPNVDRAPKPRIESRSPRAWLCRSSACTPDSPRNTSATARAGPRPSVRSGPSTAAESGARPRTSLLRSTFTRIAGSPTTPVVSCAQSGRAQRATRQTPNAPRRTAREISPGTVAGWRARAPGAQTSHDHYPSGGWDSNRGLRLTGLDPALTSGTSILTIRETDRYHVPSQIAPQPPRGNRIPCTRVPAASPGTNLPAAKGRAFETNGPSEQNPGERVVSGSPFHGGSGSQFNGHHPTPGLLPLPLPRGLRLRCPFQG